ncbi:MAG: iron-sulfur cluster insertion protein ErpA [Rhodospirillales bacterium]
MPDGATPNGPQLGISEGAVKRLKAMMADEGNPALKFRITVSGGGCSGFQYGFDFDDTVNDDDMVFERDGVAVVVDEVSMQFLAGAQLEFKQELIGSYFALENPNASSTCGCGTSFSI